MQRRILAFLIVAALTATTVCVALARNGVLAVDDAAAFLADR